MVGKYEFGDGVIPRSVLQSEGHGWMQSIQFSVRCVCDYDWSCKRLPDHLSRAGACNYVNSLADMIGVLYEHYDSLPVVYFDLLDTAMHTLKKSALSKNPVLRDLEIRDHSRCLQKAALILRVANDKESITERLQKQLSPRWLKYWQSLQRKSERAARLPYREYLSSLCRRFGGDSNDAVIRTAYRDLENYFKQPVNATRRDNTGHNHSSFFSGIMRVASKFVDTVEDVLNDNGCNPS